MQVKAAVLAAVIAALFGFSSGPAFAAQVSCGQVITQDTKVDNDLIGCPGDGLVVGGDGITLDLDGHKITAVRHEGYIPDVAAIRGSANHVTIKNGVLGLFVYGISLEGNDNLIEDNVIATSHAMQVNGDGNVIQGNHYGGSDGMYARGNGNVFAGNSIKSGHGGLGAEGDRNLIEHNSVSGDPGLFTIGFQNQVVRNAVSGGYGGALGASGAEAVIERNVVQGGTLVGIAIYGSERARIERNVLLGTGGDGIRVGVSSGAVIARNVVSNTVEDGIRVETSSGAIVERNRVSDSHHEDGIVVGPSIVVTKNVASFNGVDDGGFGIRGEPGVIDGGGNKAFGNGNPLQCLNVVCK
jgi:parallel beta-helix repeat protein